MAQVHGQDGATALIADWAPRVVEAALDAIVTIDSSGRIVQFNGAAEHMFGYSREEAIGSGLAGLIIPPDLREAHSGGIARLAAGERSRILDRRVELRALRRSGEEFPVELTVTRSCESPALFTGFVRDLSDLREARDRRTHLERLLAAAEELGVMGTWARDLRSGEAAWSDELYRIFGLERGACGPSREFLLALVHPCDRDRMAAMLGAVLECPGAIPEQGVSLDYRIVRPDGCIRDIRQHGRVDLDEHGMPVRWFGSLQDVTEQRRTERELHAHFALGQALREWESFDEGVVDLLRRLGTALDYTVGSLWVCHHDEELLRCRAFWSAPGFDAADFELHTRDMTFRRGEGVPGRVWSTEHPVVSEDLAGSLRFHRREAAVRAGLRSGLSFAAIGDDGPLAVLSYYTPDRRAPTERLIRTVTGIGRELGSFLGRRRADLGSRRLSQRELEVLRMAAEGNTGPAIAERLFLSPATVKTHFEHIYDKLGVSDRAAAVAHALRTGLIR